MGRLQRLSLAAFVRLYPYLHASLEGVKFVYQLGYLLDVFETHSPVLQLLGQRLVRLTGQELVRTGGPVQGGGGPLNLLWPVRVTPLLLVSPPFKNRHRHAALCCNSLYIVYSFVQQQYQAPIPPSPVVVVASGGSGAAQAAAAAGSAAASGPAFQPAAGCAAQAMAAWHQHCHRSPAQPHHTSGVWFQGA